MLKAIDPIVVLISQVEGSPEYYCPLYLKPIYCELNLLKILNIIYGRASIDKTKYKHAIEFMNLKYKLIPTPNFINLVLIEDVEQQICHPNSTQQKSFPK